MRKFNALLNLRLRQKDENNPKMNALAERSTKGNLSSFSGVFRINALSEDEKNALHKILESFQIEDQEYDLAKDLEDLSLITSEVKAITNQAVILHGERIKKAQALLKSYKEGAFTSWLMTTYGNRQTPYNFLQYYEFYNSLPNDLRNKMDQMPRQAIYTLASRSGELEEKQKIVADYEGQPKQELLTAIRKLFPLDEQDKRAPNVSNQVLNSLLKTKILMQEQRFQPSIKQQQKILSLIEELHNLLSLEKNEL